MHCKYNRRTIQSGELYQITAKLRNENLEHQLKEEDIKTIRNFFVNKQTDFFNMKRNEKVNDLIYQMSSQVLNPHGTGCEDTNISTILEKINEKDDTIIPMHKHSDSSSSSDSEST
jgi:hypothetical protein